MNERLETLRAQGATISTFREAKKVARKNPGRAVYSDAGDGWTTEWVFCARRGRVCSVAISPSGERVV